jgi:beta-N-acetylhexosaminidase
MCRLLAAVILVVFLHSAYGECLPKDPKRPSLAAQLGQTLLLGFHGTNLADPDLQWLRDGIAEGTIGGVVLFSYNIVSHEQIRQLVSDLRTIPCRYPLFIGVDQEGGAVARLSPDKGFPGFPSPAEVGRKFRPAAAYRLYISMSRELRETGFNLNFAPLLDLEYPVSPVIGQLGRSFSKDPAAVVALATAFIRAHRQSGVLTVVKHFPGHGSAASDTHLSSADVTDLWGGRELFPFREIVRRGLADMVMTGHLFNAKVDSKYPASLSRLHVEGILRGKLGYRGVVISDDMQMDAVRRNYSFGDAAIAALSSGTDILLYGNFMDKYDTNLPAKFRSAVENALADGRMDPEDVYRAFQRVVTLKKRLSR